MFTTTLSLNAKSALALLGKSGLVANAYLAGGSALALHFGHRYSIDLDFFTKETFDPKKLSSALKKIDEFKEILAKGISLIGEFNRVKFSYFGYDYPLIADTYDYLKIKVAHPHDIAAMKLTATMDRGTKRDFIDLYELIRRGITLEKMFSFYDKKYGNLESNLFSLVKSLGYFDDAETTDMPRMITTIPWKEVKDFFISESLRLAKKYLK